MTNTPPIYVLDANVFIEAHQRYYAFDVCPGFWECVLHHHETARIVSIDPVRNELLQQSDELHVWVKRTATKELFDSTNDPAVIQSFQEMMTWVMESKQYNPEAKAEFAQVADGWLAAYAKVRGYVVVTQERFNKEAKKRVPLPNVCKRFGVAYQDTFSMLRALETQFFWKPQRSSPR
jgi:predicted nucleic acid-binding protein